MQKQTFHQRINFLLSLIFILCASLSVFAQSDANRRLYVAVVGYEVNEAAAKDALKAGADINWQNDQMGGETMLIMEVKGFKDPKAVKFLLDNGADPNIKDDSGKTALEWAHQYNIGRDRSGKEILAMLEAATRQTKPANPNKGDAGTATADTNAKSTNIKFSAAKRKDGGPSEEDVKEMIERKMTDTYESHFCCNEKNKVEFEWLAPIQIGGQETRGRIPVKCWAVKLDVKITFTKPSSGETSWARRGINGDPVKEGFCVFKDGFGEWDFLTYAP